MNTKTEIIPKNETFKTFDDFIEDAFEFSTCTEFIFD